MAAEDHPAAVDAGLHKCTYCPKSFTVKQALTRHVRTVHRAEESTCFHCGLRCTRKDILDRHITTQHSSVEQRTCCGKCGKPVRKRSLPAHQASDACKNAFDKIKYTVNNQACRSTQPWPSTSLLEHSRARGLYWTTPPIFPQAADSIHEPSSDSAEFTSTLRVTTQTPIEANVPSESTTASQVNSSMRLSSLSSAAHDAHASKVRTIGDPASLPSYVGQLNYFELDELDVMFPRDILVGDKTACEVRTAPLSRLRRAQYMPTPKYLNAVADPVLVSAWLFIKLKPWGSSHHWSDAIRPPLRFAKLSVEVLELQGLVYRTIRNAFAKSVLDRDLYFPDALIMLTLFTCQTEGWDAAIRRAEPLIWLAERYLRGSGTRESYETSIAEDAVATVLTRYVKPEHALPLESMFTMGQNVMRQTVIDLIDGPFENVQGPVWRRPYLSSGRLWFSNCEDQMWPILDLADSMSDNVERMNEVAD